MTTKKTEADTSATPQDEPDTAKAHYATRDFNDAGTERQFKKGAKLDDVDAGELANYVAAGLASTDRPKTDAA